VAALAGAAHLDTAIATIEAASLDPELARVLRDGHVVKERVAASGFGLTGFEVDDAREAGPRDADPPADPADELAARRRRSQELATLRRALAEAERLVTEAESTLTAAEEQRAEAERKLDAAGAATALAADAAQEAHAAADEARERLAEAEAD
jgi:hypothetical protein